MRGRKVKIYTVEMLLARGIPQPNGCITIGKPTPSARYWLVHSNHRAYHAHRLMWILLYGEPAPGLEVCHDCDNPRCINPDHLFLGTHADNMRDCNRKERRNQKKGPDRRLNAAEADLARVMVANGMTHKAVAAEFGCCEATICRIANGRTHAKSIQQAA